MEPLSNGRSVAERLDATFAALADPTRRAILARLAGGEASVMELAEPFAMTQPAISKHLKVLERAGLITRGRDAQRRPARIEALPLAEASAWLDGYRRFWEDSYRNLDALLEELQTREPDAEDAAPTRDPDEQGDDR
jgi:DNA-binding transcriptional ArsR family regulator